MSDVQAYPLSWPTGWPRATYPYPMESKFGDHSLSEAIKELRRQIELLKGTNLVISSNCTLGNSSPKDKGICVYFQYKGRPYAMPCDRWTSVEDNLWALGKHIEALRGQERWGVGSLERAFAGYAALPPPVAGADWRSVLRLPAGAKFDDAQAMYRALAQQYHPDAGGSNEKMAALNGAWEQARKHFGQ